MIHARQKRQPKPYWNIKIKSNDCKYWNNFTRECEHEKRGLYKFRCNKDECPIKIKLLIPYIRG